MKIERIELYNIGSYKGKNILDIDGIDKNIILIGGKNGAGKTTLFESIKLCFYGHRETGYQFMTNAYRKKVKSIVNNSAKLSGDTEAYISIKIELFNGQENDKYILKRHWDLSKEKIETFSVRKNVLELTEDEIEIFTNYILDLIPPELFNLYFFDGEQFEKTFLDEDGSERIKKAFMVLCGYDTIDIMLQNFKRISYNKKTTNISSTEYLESKAKLAELKARQAVIHEAEKNTYSTIEELASKTQALEANYRKSGGVTIKEWDEKLLQLKEEDAKREFLNSKIKELANDIIPFLIVRDQVEDVLNKIEEEEIFNRQKNILAELKNLLPKISEKTVNTFSLTESLELLKSFSEKFQKNLLEEVKIENINPVLQLSFSEQQIVTSAAIDVLRFDADRIIQERAELKKSLAKTKELREILDNCNIDDVQNFLQRKEQLSEEKKGLLDKLQDILASKAEIENAVKNQEVIHKHNTKNLETELKNNSIVDLSSKAIFFLEKLQSELLKNEIFKLEDLFMKKLNEIMRKDHFIDKVKIDDDFNIHVFKSVSANKKESGKEIEVMHEFEKDRMSMGEKQIFVMALYWSLMQLTTKQVPFIMDTPLARIDMEHREKICKYFFNELNGQIFIFSTDEEITGEQLNILEEKIGKTFLLENDGVQSTITEKEYFSRK